jgi:hypothetical protein
MSGCTNEVVLHLPNMWSREYCPVSVDLARPLSRTFGLSQFALQPCEPPTNNFDSHMLSQRTARALFNSIPRRSPSQLPCSILHLETSIRPNGPPTPHPRQSSSSTRWKSRQGRDSYAREAKVQGLKSRAAFKLLEVQSTLLS